MQVFWLADLLAMNYSCPGSLRFMGYRLAEVFIHEFPIRFPEPGYAVEDVPPGIVIVALAYDAAIGMEPEHRGTIDRGARRFLEHHGHGPLHEDDIPFLGHSMYAHPQLFAPPCQALAQSLEGFQAFEPLDGVLEYDIRMVKGIDVGPVKLALGVVGL